MKPGRSGSLVIAIFVTLLLGILSLSTTLTPISGGVSFAAERKYYRLLVARPGKNITTQLRVWAINEEEAKEDVALNGWQILSIEEATPGEVYRSKMRGADGEAVEYTVNITTVGEGDVQPRGSVKVTGGENLTLSISPAPCEKLSKIIVNGIESEATESYTLTNVSANGSVVVVFQTNGASCSENGILNQDLKEISTSYFNLGEFDTKPTDQFMTNISTIAKNKKYLVIGYTDDTSVQPNKEFKDNFQLSVKRAEFIKSKLSEIGIPADNIKTLGLGPAFPAEKNEKKGQALNRRVVVYERR